MVVLPFLPLTLICKHLNSVQGAASAGCIPLHPDTVVLGSALSLTVGAEDKRSVQGTVAEHSGKSEKS